jgi:hypothetical protein
MGGFVGRTADQQPFWPFYDSVTRTKPQNGYSIPAGNKRWPIVKTRSDKLPPLAGFERTRKRFQRWYSSCDCRTRRAVPTQIADYSPRIGISAPFTSAIICSSRFEDAIVPRMSFFRSPALALSPTYLVDHHVGLFRSAQKVIKGPTLS